MKTEEIRKKILENEKFVLEECKKLQTLYVLKRVIRYSMDREEEIDTESVAEHVFAMQALITYFLPFEDPENKMDLSRLFMLAEFHDIDEIETGDFTSYNKTTEQIAAGKAAVPVVIAKLPDSMQQLVSEILDEYEKQESKEAKYVKAIDKIEPSFHVYSENGMKINLKVTGVSYQDHRKIKDKYTEEFPIIHRFSDVLSRSLRDEGYFSQ